MGHYHFFIDEATKDQTIPYNITVGNTRASIIQMNDNISNGNKNINNISLNVVFSDILNIYNI